MASTAPTVGATGRLEYGDKIASEEPTFCTQAPGYHKTLVSCCYACLRPLGTLEENLQACLPDGEAESSLDEPVPWAPAWATKLDQTHAKVSCPRGCGAQFCSQECLDRANRMHHDVLCVGPCTEDDPIYKFKTLVLERYILVFDLVAQVCVCLAKGGETEAEMTDAVPSFSRERVGSFLPFGEHARDFGDALGTYGDAMLAVAEDLRSDGDENPEDLAEDLSLVIAELFELLMATMEAKALPGARALRSWGPDFFARLATWVDVVSVGVECLSPAGRYVNGLLGGREANEILDACSRMPALGAALSALASVDGDDDDGGELDIVKIQEAHDEGDLFLPNVSGLVFSDAVASYGHSCQPSVAISFSPLDARVIVQANHAMAAGHRRTLCYRRGSETHDETLEFLHRNGMDCCSCSTCSHRAELREMEAMGGATEADLEALDRMGKIAFEEERYEDACDVYSRVVELTRADGSAWVAYGRALVNLDRWSRGYDVWREGAEAARVTGSPHEELETLMASHRYYRAGVGSRKGDFALWTGTKNFALSDCCGWAVEGEEDPRLPRNVRWGAFFVQEPVLSRPECAAIIEEAEGHAAERQGWSTKRHYSVPTTDIPAHALPGCLSALNRALERSIFPAISSRFGEDVSDLQVHDAFVIKYSMDGQKFLPIHTDQSHYSATIGLNSAG